MDSQEFKFSGISEPNGAEQWREIITATRDLFAFLRAFDDREGLWLLNLLRCAVRDLMRNVEFDTIRHAQYSRSGDLQIANRYLGFYQRLTETLDQIAVLYSKGIVRDRKSFAAILRAAAAAIQWDELPVMEISNDFLWPLIPPEHMALLNSDTNPHSPKKYWPERD